LFFCYAFFATQKKAFGDKNKSFAGLLRKKACYDRLALLLLRKPSACAAAKQKRRRPAELHI
jgi:hypothetical protein